MSSRPGPLLIARTMVCVGIGIILPFTPLAIALGFVAPRGDFFAFLALVAVTSLLLTH